MIKCDINCEFSNEQGICISKDIKMVAIAYLEGKASGVETIPVCVTQKVRKIKR